MEKTKTKYPGVRTTTHRTRKHNGKPDKCFFIRYYYRINNTTKEKEEVVGWTSEGMDAKRASIERARLQLNQRMGEGAQTLKERRKNARAKSEESQRVVEAAEKKSIPFERLFLNHYLPNAKTNKKASSTNREISLFENWINPCIGRLPLHKIKLEHLDELKEGMTKKGLAPRTVLYALAVIRQVFNWADRYDWYSGPNPISRVKKPSVNNGRLRFLTRDEVAQLLDALKDANQEVYEQALLSLHCGLRAGEVFNLIWSAVDTNNGTLIILDPKNGKNRVAYLTQETRLMFRRKKAGKANEYVFTNKDGGKIKEISRVYERVVKELGFNKDIKDSRLRVCFHTLRATYASYLSQAGVELIEIRDRLGHSDLKMVSRYAHSDPERSKKTVKVFDDFEPDKPKVIFSKK